MRRVRRAVIVCGLVVRRCQAGLVQEATRNEPHIAPIG